jgi:hypothetical protein
MAKYHPIDRVRTTGYIWRCPFCNELNVTDSLVNVQCAYESICDARINCVSPEHVVEHRVARDNRLTIEQQHYSRQRRRANNLAQLHRNDRQLHKNTKKACPICYTSVIRFAEFCPQCSYKFNEA